MRETTALRRFDIRTDVAACYRVYLAVKQTPFLQGHHIPLVERAKPFLRERRGRAQLAPAERGQWPAGLSDHTLDCGKTRLDRHRCAKADPLDGVSRQRGHPGRVLKDAREKAIAAG